MWQKGDTCEEIIRFLSFRFGGSFSFGGAFSFNRLFFLGGGGSTKGNALQKELHNSVLE